VTDDLSGRKSVAVAVPELNAKAGENPPITSSEAVLPEGAGQPFDAQGTARDILRRIRVATLATLDPLSGFPLATLVNVADDADGAPILFLSGLSLHTRNLLADPRASLLLADIGKGDALAHPRLTLVGRCAPSDAPGLKDRFLAAHPKGAIYAGLPDFRAFRFAVEGVHLNGGFARAAPLTPADVIDPPLAP
jgi:putative heme iron utilization protein